MPSVGFKHSEESKAAMRASALIRKSGGGMTGKSHSEESNRANREKHLGKIPWNKGIKMPESFCETMSKVQKGRIPWNKKKPLCFQVSILHISDPIKTPRRCVRLRIQKTCETCGKIFTVTKSRSDRQPCKYCSKKCYGNALKKSRIQKICPHCGKHFERVKSRNSRGWSICCSKKCWTKYAVQDHSPQWQNGRTELQKIIRMHSKSAEWRTAIFKRDNFKDWFSGCTGDIVAHHIVPFSKLIKKYHITSLEEALQCEQLWDINNGVTMLRTSHIAHHMIWG